VGFEASNSFTAACLPTGKTTAFSSVKQRAFSTAGETLLAEDGPVLLNAVPQGAELGSALCTKRECRRSRSLPLKLAGARIRLEGVFGPV
jgi:hypothetical protein